MIISLILTAFAIIAIIIGSMGLYGLVSSMANQNTKEVGIRKTLGANTTVVYQYFKVTITNPVTSWKVD